MEHLTKNILIVDDKKSNIDILLGLFEKVNTNNQYELITALSGEKALKIVEKIDIDLILLDIIMPGLDGYEICKILKSNEKTKDIPILFITANTDEESIAKAYNIGAADFVTKPFRPVELLARVKVNLKLQETIKQLEHLAYYDVMTNIYNRRKFFELALEKFETSKENLYAVMLDIDKFKSINDTHGHAEGDKVIKEVARIFKDNINNNIIIGRLGGEEFGMLLNADSTDEVISIVENIRIEIEKTKTITDNQQFVNFTISDGVAKYSEDIKTLDHLLQKADEALYEAKESGRNKSIFRI